MQMLKAFGLRGVAAMILALFALPAFGADYSGLTRIRALGFHEAYALNGALPSGFHSVYVAPVGIVPGDERLDNMSARDRRTMQDYFHDQLTSRLGSRFQLVNVPGPGVLVVEAAFTTLQSNRITMDEGVKNPNIDVARSFGIGRAGVVISLRDGSSSLVLATFADEQSGQTITNNPHVDSMWGDAMSFCRGWARDLTDLLTN